MKLIFTPILFLFVSLLSNAQEGSLLLMNGKVKTISNYTIIEEEDLILYTNSKGRQMHVYMDDVFSISDLQSKEVVFYKPDFELGETLTNPEMRLYLNGVQHGEKYKAKWAFLGGLASGFAGALMPQPKISAGSFSMSVPVGYFLPFGYVLVVGNSSKSSKSIKRDFPSRMDDEYFIEGVGEAVQKKRMKNSLWGAGVGILAGIITNSFMN